MRQLCISQYEKPDYTEFETFKSFFQNSESTFSVLRIDMNAMKARFCGFNSKRIHFFKNLRVRLLILFEICGNQNGEKINQQNTIN